MGLAKLKAKLSNELTVGEYLIRERDAFERSEYIDGEVYQMAGESDAHGDISVNLVRELSLQLKGKDCRVRTKETKVKSGGPSAKVPSSTKGMFSYPDVMIVCGEVEYHDRHKDIILNPKVIIEVLSPSTEIYKFLNYRMFNETLTDYLLISQDKPMIEHFIRQKDNSWSLYTHVGLGVSVPIKSAGCSLALAEVYDRVKFSDEARKFLKEIANRK